MRYFIDTEFYLNGELQPPRKVYLSEVRPFWDGAVICYDEEGNDYTIPLTAIKRDRKRKSNDSNK